MYKIVATACFIIALFPLPGQDLPLPDPHEGLWMGELRVTEQLKLHLAFQIDLNGDGSYSAKMNVIEQKAFDIPMDICFIISDSLVIHFEAANITYQGIYSEDKSKITGNYYQGGGTFPLELDPVESLTREVMRPQTPVRPFPYEEEEVEFDNVEAGISLAGTLTKPKGGKKLPAVVLIAGSGKSDRDETAMGHFLLLSDYLTRNGYAVLRYDKRGVGESGGDYSQATTYDFAQDAKAAVDYLKGRTEINSKHLGLIGHSEGALIAPMLAADYKKDVSFIVMLGGIGVTGTELILLQSAEMARISGVPEDHILEMNSNNRIIYDIASSEEPDSVVAVQLKEAMPGIDENMFNMLQWDWLRTFLALNPDDYLSRVECPVLALNGEHDIQCPPKENLAAIENSLQKAGNKDHSVSVVPGVNHLFQTTDSGSPYEYDQLEEIISPEVLARILAWMDQVVK